MTRATEAGTAVRRVLPVILAVMPFGAVYGAVAVKAGFTVVETMGFSATVYAGSSQLVAVQMIGLGSPLWSVVLSIFALNFRHVLYSASLGRHLDRFGPGQKAAAFFLLVDPVFGEAEARAGEGPLTKTFYFTYCLLLYAFWMLATLAGALSGRLVEDPRSLALDFVLPVYFLALLLAFRGRAGFYPVSLASAAAAIVLYLTVGSPWHVTLGALAGIAYAAAAVPRDAQGGTGA